MSPFNAILRTSLAVLFAAVVSGCGGEPSPSNDPQSPAAANREADDPAASSPNVAGKTYSGSYPIRIVTTCSMVTDIVRQVAGEHADVVGLLGESVDPHTHTPNRNDIKQMLQADLVFYSGLHLEGRMQDAFQNVARDGKPVFPVTEGIDKKYLYETPDFEGHYDPHVWMDVTAWSKCVEFVEQRLASFDPPHAEDYRSRSEQYREELKKLDAYVREVIASIPESQRVLVTAHDAFGYFSRAYGIEIRSVQGLSTDS
ncbi:MAG: metal ABC transporter solute-binding protein, Zn/Mn family, partial [Planctomycetaceae bacterium]